ncbi:hypothetical protein [Streptomyces sp. NPDC001307]|uniref:hypothetical protein n=1 Tax=Streptomyces sp. NPDC001307 TaxID=3364560 RepID=UPI00367CC257
MSSRTPTSPWTWVVFGVFAAWLAVICYFIDRQTSHTPPQRGAVTSARLLTEATDAVRAHDPAEFERLFGSGTVGPDYARRYFDELFAYPLGRLNLTTQDKQDTHFLVLRAVSSYRSVCSSWVVQRDGGRSVLTAVPSLVDPCELPAQPSQLNPPFAAVDVHGVTAQKADEGHTALVGEVTRQ